MPDLRAGVITNRILVGLLAAMFLFALSLEASPEHLTLPGVSEPLPEFCVYKKPDVSCSGCGLTRSTMLTLQGRVSTAREVHPGGLWMAGFLIIQFLMRIAGSFRRFAYLWPWDLAVTLVLIVICLTRW